MHRCVMLPPQTKRFTDPELAALLNVPILRCFVEVGRLYLYICVLLLRSSLHGSVMGAVHPGV